MKIPNVKLRGGHAPGHMRDTFLFCDRGVLSPAPPWRSGTRRLFRSAPRTRAKYGGPHSLRHFFTPWRIIRRNAGGKDWRQRWRSRGLVTTRSR
jgi:hypothetical protein